MSIFNRFGAGLSNGRTLTPVQSGPRAADVESMGDTPPGLDNQSTAGVLPPGHAWHPEADIAPPPEHGPRLYVPTAQRVPPTAPPRSPVLENPADEVDTVVRGSGTALRRSLAFPAHAVLVDNLTTQWLYVPAAQRYVPPFTYGAVLPLLQSTAVAEYQVSAPAGYSQGTNNPSQYVVTTWTAAMLGYSPGLSLPAVNGAGNLTVSPVLFNGSTYDPQYNNAEFTLLAGGSPRSSTTATSTQTNYNARGLALFLRVTAASGTGGLQVRLNGVEPVSGVLFGMNILPTAITATGTSLYLFYPAGSMLAMTPGQTAAVPLPRSWAAQVIHGDASNYTYSLTGCYLT